MFYVKSLIAAVKARMMVLQASVLHQQQPVIPVLRSVQGSGAQYNPFGRRDAKPAAARAQDPQAEGSESLPKRQAGRGNDICCFCIHLYFAARNPSI